MFGREKNFGGFGERREDGDLEAGERGGGSRTCEVEVLRREGLKWWRSSGFVLRDFLWRPV